MFHLANHLVFHLANHLANHLVVVRQAAARLVVHHPLFEGLLAVIQVLHLAVVIFQTGYHFLKDPLKSQELGSLDAGLLCLRDLQA